MRTVLVLLVSVACCACSAPGQTPESVELRWGNEPFVPLAATEAARIEPRSANDRDFWLRYRRRPGARAIRIALWGTFDFAECRGVRILDRRSRTDVAPLPAGDDPIDVHYTHAPETVSLAELGDVDTLLRADFRDDATSVIAGVVLLVVGALALGVLALSRRRSAPATWLGAFAVSAGVLHAWQAESVRMFVVPSLAFWNAIEIPTIVAQVLTFGMLVDSLFRLRDRLLHVLLAGAVVAVAVWTIGALTGHDVVDQVRWAIYVIVAVAFVDLVARISKRRRDPTARTFVIGFVGFIALGVPDVLWQLGVPLFRAKLFPFGSIFFTATIALLLERQIRGQRDALERNVGQVQRLNVELRRQIASRSREIAKMLENPHLREETHLREGVTIADRYRLVECVGAGGMGAVYRAERKVGDDVDLVAVKVMAGSVDPDGAARFVREAEIASAVDHENLVTVLDVGVDRGALYIVMELVDGPSLEEMRERFGEVAEMLPLLVHTARGLAALHGANVVHRDLKPGNVLVADGVAKISDFGISRRTSEATEDAATERQITHPGAVMGTPLYMAPESLRGAELSGTSADMFAFGVMAYEMLTSARPFDVAPSLAVFVTGSLPPPPSLGALGIVAPEVAALLDRCILQEPTKRPTAAEVADVLASAAMPTKRSY